MKIKTRLRLNTFISLCVVILILLSLVWSFREILIADRNMELVDEMRKVAFERILLRDEYLLYQEKRAAMQWHAKSEILRGLLALADTRFEQEEDKVLLQEARKDFEATLSGMSRVMEGHTRQDPGANTKPGFSDAELRLISQVLLKAYSLTDNINRLHESAHKTATSARNRGAFIIVIFILGGIIAIITNSTVVGRTLAKRVAALGKGVEFMGAGDLDYRIAAEGDDELSSLALANNEMAAKLKESYTSVENLNKEIAQRKRAEEELQALFLRRKAMLAAVPDIIMEVDNNKVYTWANQAGLEFFGPEVLGKEAASYFEEQQDTYDAVQPLFNGNEEVFYLESWQRRKDGEKRLLAWWCRVLKDEKGNVAGALSSAQDITERKHAEEEIRKLNEELEQRVIARTAQLEAANKELEAFSYTVSHDLRAPLRHLIGFVELLNKRAPASLDEKTRHYLTVISDSATQMSMLVDDLLSFSRMARAEMLKARVSIDKLVREAMNTLQTETRGRDIDWKINPLPEVNGDSAMLQLVVVNLISNAVKFTRTRPKAAIEIGCNKDDKNEYIFYVRDNGVGFDIRYTDKLFNLFQRLHRTEEFEGTGVGLANVRRIIQRHGGRTWAEGSVDGGATFYFSLPKQKE